MGRGPQQLSFAAFSSSGSSSGEGGASDNAARGSGGSSSSGGGQDVTSTLLGAAGGSGAARLQETLDKLVDSAVELVEAGRLAQAVEVLVRGTDVLREAYPGSAELGELHNQAALLLFFQDKPGEAATHAQEALAITQHQFGTVHPLTGHRLLRLGTIRLGEGRSDDAAPLLATAADMLRGQEGDAGAPEAAFYLELLRLGAARDEGEVWAAEPVLVEAMQVLVRLLGGESMIVRLALGQHSRLVGRALDGVTGPAVVGGGGGAGFALGEALFKQHMRLQEVQDAQSPELALTTYQLATTYYAHDMLTDAGQMVQRAAQLLRAHYSEDHDLVRLARHRAGMVCAASGDHRAATKLLTEAREHYRQQQEGHPLQHEAELGLAMARFRALDARLPREERVRQQSELLGEMAGSAAALARALGPDHMLALAAARWHSQLSVMAGVR